MDIKRVIILVLDSVGAGEAEDAIEYGDWGANTLLHTLQFNPDLRLPHLEKLGLRGVMFNESGDYAASYGRLKENSKGKDSISGHWEMAGVILTKAFPTYPHGFPKEVGRTDPFGGVPTFGRPPLCHPGGQHAVSCDCGLSACLLKGLL